MGGLPKKGPDIWLTGTLRLLDRSRFERVLCSGLGDYAAFGFGTFVLRGQDSSPLQKRPFGAIDGLAAC